jgi:transposase InsO family protein
MSKELVARGVRVGKERVRKLMAQHGIRARHKRKYIATTNSNHNLPVAPNLLERNFTASAPNQVWTSDITYLATAEGWVYPAVVIDLFSRPLMLIQPLTETSEPSPLESGRRAAHAVATIPYPSCQRAPAQSRRSSS